MAVISSPGVVEFLERELPPIRGGEVLIGVKAAAICGSDLHIYKGAHPAVPLPVTIGHELAGEILEVGENVTKVNPGDRVAVEPVIVCGECVFCRQGQYHLCTNISFQYREGQGGFTTHFVSDQDWVHVLPDGLSFEEGALMEPLAVSVHAMKKSGLEMGHSAAIFGDGPIGLMLLMLANLAGAGQVFMAGAQDFRLEVASRLGAARTYNNIEADASALILEQTHQLGVDRVFEAAGLETTLVQCLKVLKKGGQATLIGLFEEPDVRIPANLFIQKEIGLTGSQGYCWDFQTAISLVSRGKLNLRELITHILPLSSLEQGFEILMDSDSQAVKVVVTNP
jgi:2-desacetyl-2-hydroxyethyl bacteriochlorophyllide A dehydrogenase